VAALAPVTDGEEALAAIQQMYALDAAREFQLFPVIGYYGSGRAWLPSNSRSDHESHPARRWGAFKDCLSERIRFSELNGWFRREAVAAGSNGGHGRLGFQVVQGGLAWMFPNADRLWFDSDRDEAVLSAQGQVQPLSNLSAGQKMMFSLIADIAIKAVTQNAGCCNQALTLPSCFDERPVLF